MNNKIDSQIINHIIYKFKNFNDFIYYYKIKYDNFINKNKLYNKYETLFIDIFINCLLPFLSLKDKLTFLSINKKIINYKYNSPFYYINSQKNINKYFYGYKIIKNIYLKNIDFRKEINIKCSNLESIKIFIDYMNYYDSFNIESKLSKYKNIKKFKLVLQSNNINNINLPNNLTHLEFLKDKYSFISGSLLKNNNFKLSNFPESIVYLKCFINNYTYILNKFRKIQLKKLHLLFTNDILFKNYIKYKKNLRIVIPKTIEILILDNFFNFNDINIPIKFDFTKSKFHTLIINDLTQLPDNKFINELPKTLKNIIIYIKYKLCKKNYEKILNNKIFKNFNIKFMVNN